ncbi:MAG: DUF3179 domain-containing protein [Rhodothermales bacterium]
MPFIVRFIALSLLLTGTACGQSTDRLVAERSDWQTEWDRRSIDLSELIPGGPPKDGIPSIDDPSFVSIQDARPWLEGKEPVISLAIEDEARAYPLQIMTYHEIANHELADTPVVVSFCPLCYSAVVFSRDVGGEVLTFGVSGLLRHSDLVMFDRQSESLWQQVTGEAIVGGYTGTTLDRIPAQIISFAQFAESYPDGLVLSRDTGYDRPYGRNPYAGYDDVGRRPFLYDGPTDERLPPMEKVVAVESGESYKAYPHSVTRERRVIHDELDGRAIVVFHADGAVSALDAAEIPSSREIGSTGVFERSVGERTLHFDYDDGRFVDRETGSRWTITGEALDGPLRGQRLTPLDHGDYFSFAWFAFRPDTEIYTP